MPIDATPCRCETCGRSFVLPRWAVTRGRGRFCTKGCANLALRRPLAARFWAKVDQSGGPDACWPWMGHRNEDGYGQLKLGPAAGQRKEYTHRISWGLHFGGIPAGQFVCHRCDQRYPPGDTSYRRCVNPAHLWLGTSAENTADMMAKGRNGQTGPRRPLRGERHPMARVSEPLVRQLRQAYDAGGISVYRLAKDHHLGYTCVRLIVKRSTWRHLP